MLKITYTRKDKTEMVRVSKRTAMKLHKQMLVITAYCAYENPNYIGASPCYISPMSDFNQFVNRFIYYNNKEPWYYIEKECLEFFNK